MRSGADIPPPNIPSAPQTLWGGGRGRHFNIKFRVPTPQSQGYQGLVDGGDNIKEATWESVSMMLQLVSGG